MNLELPNTLKGLMEKSKSKIVITVLPELVIIKEQQVKLSIENRVVIEFNEIDNYHEALDAILEAELKIVNKLTEKFKSKIWSHDTKE